MMVDIFNYKRRKTQEVVIGNTSLGFNHPIRIQSMTTTSTNDVEGSIDQIKKLKNAGSELVRLTAQGMREVEHLATIKECLRKENETVPLVADIHFNPKVADASAKIVEKVRINPGNYVDPGRTFKTINYTDEEYQDELNRLEKRFVEFLNICKENKTAIRIGVNHGSLSDRIMNRYGDTPAGIVESCMEFLRVCKKENFTNVVVSVKASNTVVMVQSVRLLVAQMDKENISFPLHLGVTEAGEGEDGRIKSAVGIGALLADGLGDTIRVSLSEDPVNELPVANKLLAHVKRLENHPKINAIASKEFDYCNPQRRSTHKILNIGGGQVPVVISDRLDEDTVENMEMMPDYIYCGDKLPALEQRKGVAYIVDAHKWKGEEKTYPVFPSNMLMMIGACNAELKFLFLSYEDLNEEVIACLRFHPEVVIISQSRHVNRIAEHRALVHSLMNNQLKNPVVLFQIYNYPKNYKEDFQIEAAADTGALIIDGLCDGIFLFNLRKKEEKMPHKVMDETAFAILQAARARMSKTEYISCPGCGRTLYDLQSTIARIKEATKDLKGLKIGIMGCIVNGPGEMADADYGYVGAAKGKISLYRNKECVEKNIPTEQAVEKLLELIHKDGHL